MNSEPTAANIKLYVTIVSRLYFFNAVFPTMLYREYAMPEQSPQIIPKGLKAASSLLPISPHTSTQPVKTRTMLTVFPTVIRSLKNITENTSTHMGAVYISISETAIDDIAVLNSIRNKLHAHELLDKLIYDTYVSKPVLEMVKRVLKGESPSGIYKITRLKTGEIYIGKSTDVRSRWQQHLKTAFGVGTIAHSILHTTMEKDGVQNFTFELLEEVPKDKLTEREKYWINFYDSKSYGLNEREG